MGLTGTDLKSPTDTGRRDARRRRPRPVCEPRNDETRSCLAAKNKAGLEDGEDSEACRKSAPERGELVVPTLGKLHDLGWNLVDAVNRVAQLRRRLADLRCELAA